MKSVLLNIIDGEKVQYNPDSGGLDPWEAIPCLRCGVCCSRWQAPCNRKEMSIMAKSLGISLSTFIRKYTQKYPYKRGEYLLKHNQNGCIFLTYENDMAACKIHDVSPEACKNWTPSLSQSECRQGLRQRDDKLLLPGEMYPEGGELNLFLTCM